MTYEVGLKGVDNKVTVRAKTELEAMIKYCEKNGFNYRLIAPKLEVVRQKKGTKNENS